MSDDMPAARLQPRVVHDGPGRPIVIAGEGPLTEYQALCLAERLAHAVRLNMFVTTKGVPS